MKTEIPKSMIEAAARALREESRKPASPVFTMESISKAVLEAAGVGEIYGLLIELRHSLSPAYRLSPEVRAYIEKMDSVISKYK